jgi:hypothetical protein
MLSHQKVSLKNFFRMLAKVYTVIRGRLEVD